MKISVITETTGDMEANEPSGSFAYQGNDYPYWGSPLGRSKTEDYSVGKFNRYAKIGVRADDLVNEFHDKLVEVPNLNDGKCSFASLIMMKYGIRIGNEDSAMGYESGLDSNVGEIVQTYGTTTLLNKHVMVEDGILKLDFLGKTQVQQSVEIDDPFIVKYAKHYHDSAKPEEKWIGIDYDILFKFVKSNIGDIFIPKDFRTFCANVTGWKAIKTFLNKPKRETITDANSEVKLITEVVADQLGNTPGISKRNYIDNRMLDWFKSERLGDNV
jgi:hypothetical protein